MFLSGILPMSSAVTTSTTESALLFSSIDCLERGADAGDDHLSAAAQFWLEVVASPLVCACNRRCCARRAPWRLPFRSGSTVRILMIDSPQMLSLADACTASLQNTRKTIGSRLCTGFRADSRGTTYGPI